MLNYAPLESRFTNTNSLLPVMDFLMIGSNEMVSRKAKENISEHVKVNQVKSDGLISSFYYEHALGNVFISNYKKLTQEINDLSSAHNTNIYSFLEKKIRSFSMENYFENDLFITQQAIDEACYFFKTNVEFHGLVPPKIQAIPTDEINFNWDRKNFHLDLAIVGDGTYSFYMKDKLTGEELCYDIGITDRLPDFIVKKLSGENVWS